jgi:hypothetical protein
MVVHQKKASRMIPERCLHDLSGVNAASCQSPLKQVFCSDDSVLGIQEDDLEYLPFFVSKAVVQVIEEFLGRTDRVLSDEFFLSCSGGASITPCKVLKCFKAALACSLQSLRGVAKVRSSSMTS